MKSWHKRANSSYKTQDTRRKTQDARRKTQGLTYPVSCVFLVAAIAVIVLMDPAFSILYCYAAVAKAESTSIINYSAKEMTFDRKTGITVLKGEAKIRRSSGDYLNADQITMYKDVKTDELIKIEAVGNVDMKEKDMTAVCEHAIFYEAEERIELESSGDSPAVVDDGKNRMEAPSITYFRKEDRLEAKGNVSGHVTIEGKESDLGSPSQALEKLEQRGNAGESSPAARISDSPSAREREEGEKNSDLSAPPSTGNSDSEKTKAEPETKSPGARKEEERTE